MVTKASASRVERYTSNVEELKSSRMKAILLIALFIVITFVDWIGGIMIFYHDKNIGLEPLFWAVLLGIFIICFIGEFIAFRKFTKVNDQYHEAVKRLEALGKSSKIAANEGNAK